MLIETMISASCIGCYVTSKKSLEIMRDLYKDSKRNKMLLTPAKKDFITARERLN